MYTLKTKDEGSTMLLGERLGLIISYPCVLILTGGLGAGKTIFTQGLCRGMEVEEDVYSPSFTIMNLYQGRMPLYHFDFYRLEEEAELWELDLEEYFYGEGVCAVEWGDKFPGILPHEYLEIHLEPLPEFFTERMVTLIPQGNYPKTLAKELIRSAGSGD